MPRGKLNFPSLFDRSPIKRARYKKNFPFDDEEGHLIELRDKVLRAKVELLEVYTSNPYAEWTVGSLNRAVTRANREFSGAVVNIAFSALTKEKYFEVDSDCRVHLLSLSPTSVK